MTPFAILFTLAAIGIAETAYLIRSRKEQEKPVCPIGGGCAAVLESRYNVTLGVHNDLLGLAFYLAMAALTGLLVIGKGPLETWNMVANLLVIGALAMSVRFVYLQWQVIKAWCFWCLMSTATIVGMALILSANGFTLVLG